MPKIYRVMKDDNGKPKIGTAGAMLGVRIKSETSKGDIDPDANGDVHPNQRGLSVNPSIQSMPPELLPKRLRAIYPEAAGRDTNFVWSHGSGPFVQGPVAPHLELRPNKASHGFVGP